MSLLTKSYRTYTVEQLTGAGTTRTYTALSGRYYKGFIQPISGQERFAMQKSGELSTHRLYTDVRAVLVKGYRITDSNNRKYVVVFASQDEGITGFSKHKEILLKEYK